jgi:hypothetical protein
MNITVTGSATPRISTVAMSSQAAGRFDIQVWFRSVRNALSNSLASMFSFGRSSIATSKPPGGSAIVSRCPASSMTSPVSSFADETSASLTRMRSPARQLTSSFEPDLRMTACSGATARPSNWMR